MDPCGTPLLIGWVTGCLQVLHSGGDGEELIRSAKAKVNNIERSRVTA